MAADSAAVGRPVVERAVVGKPESDPRSRHGANAIDRTTIENAITQQGFENWLSDFSRVPHRIQPDGTLGDWEFDYVPESDKENSARFRPQFRPQHLPGTGRVAGVMMLLCPIDSQLIESIHAMEDVHCFFDPFEVDGAGNDIALLLTQRPATMADHAGQISFPGGKQEPGESIEVTALRELHEEIGIGAENVDILGPLKPVYIPPSDFTMYPFVGWWKTNSTAADEPFPRILRNTSEVQNVLAVSLRKLVDPKTLEHGLVQSGVDREGQPRMLHVPYYRLGSLQVWGATAIVISELLARLLKSNALIQH